MEGPDFEIVPGRKYLIKYGECEVAVQIVRKSAVNGWWFCVTEHGGEQAVFPASAFVEQLPE